MKTTDNKLDMIRIAEEESETTNRLCNKLKAETSARKACHRLLRQLCSALFSWMPFAGPSLLPILMAFGLCFH